MKARRKSNIPVQSVLRALTILETLASKRGEVGITELSEKVGLHVSTVHRLLSTLMAKGYVRQNPENGRYTLGPKAFHLGHAYLEQHELRKGVRPFLERLSQTSGETANLVILDQGEAFYLDKVESERNLRIFSRIGHRAPLHCTAVGKVLLAHMPREKAREFIYNKPLEALTRNTITSPLLLEQELKKVKEQGFAFDQEECEDGACCIGVPLRDFTGEVVAAMSISGPSIRLTPKRLEELVPLMKEMGGLISSQLGYRPEGTPKL